MRRMKKPSTEKSDMATEQFSASPPSGWLTSKGLGEVLWTTFGGAALLLGFIAFEYGILSGILDLSEAEEDRLGDKWVPMVMLICGAVGFAVALFGWALWSRVARWMLTRIGAENFDRTRPLRMFGSLVLVAIVALGILGIVGLLETLGF